MKKANIASKIISIIVGVMFLAGGLLFFFKYDPDAYDMQGTGTVVDIVESYEMVGDDDQFTYTVFIDYEVNGEKYERIEYFEYHTGMQIGDTVEFYYMSTDPSQIAGSDKNLGPYIGLAFAVVGLVMLVITVVKIVRKTPM